MRRIYLFSIFLRIWHGFQALLMITLLLTGWKLHFPEIGFPVAFHAAITMHKFAAVGLLMLALFGTVYHLFSGEVRHYFIDLKALPGALRDQFKYYTRGMFRGESSPFKRNDSHRLNHLQRIVYLAIFTVLLPLQVVSGLAMWGTVPFPAALGGEELLAGIHTAIAWLLTAFLLTHLYLITTGARATTHLKAMVTGWEDEEPGGTHDDDDAKGKDDAA